MSQVQWLILVALLKSMQILMHLLLRLPVHLCLRKGNDQMMPYNAPGPLSGLHLMMHSVFITRIILTSFVGLVQNWFFLVRSPTRFQRLMQSILEGDTRNFISRNLPLHDAGEALKRQQIPACRSMPNAAG